MNIQFAELIGALIGDGFLEGTKGHYRFGLVGHPLDDREYYEYLSGLLFNVTGKPVKPVIRERGIRITVSNKTIFQELAFTYGIPIGKVKSATVKIPRHIYSFWGLSKHTIRGIADTDGSVFAVDKPGSPLYPSIEITTSSPVLAHQIRNILLSRGFKVANIWSYKSKKSVLTTYKIPLNGHANLAKWLEEIGFSNPTKRRKAERILNQQKNS